MLPLMPVKKEAKSVYDPLPKELYNILACPLCKSDIKYSEDKKWLVCVSCKQKYPIKDKIPVLLPPK